MIREKLLVSSSKLTTFKIGGNAAIVYEPSSLDSLADLVRRLDNYYIIGNGSNVVFPDSGIRRPIIRLPAEFASWQVVECFPDSLDLVKNINVNSAFENQNEINVLVFAAMSLMRLSSDLTNLSLTGLEFAAGIPATLGGAVAMNAGAHGSEISDLVESLYVMDAEGKIKKIEKALLSFSYRNSTISGIVVAAALKLRHGDKDQVVAKRRSCLEYRKSTQPLSMPSAGSVFLNIQLPNNEIKYAASLLESIGIKGQRIGGVEFSQMHSNWIVKVSEDAKTEDLIKLINKAQAIVKEKYSLDLITEIKFWS